MYNLSLYRLRFVPSASIMAGVNLAGTRADSQNAICALHQEQSTYHPVPRYVQLSGQESQIVGNDQGHHPVEDQGQP
jgi:hypothetical protein